MNKLNLKMNLSTRFLIFAEVEGIEDIPIISVDSKEEGKKE